MTLPARRQELAANLARVRERIERACAQAGRDPAGVTLIAVTKTFPATDVMQLAELGLLDIGENRDQEAAPKAAAVAAAGISVRWHFVGQLQRNKCRSVVGYAEVVHSVDGVRLAHTLATAAQRRDRPLDVLVQVSLDGDPERGGAVTTTDAEGSAGDRDLDRVLAAVAAGSALRLRGVMTVAPMAWPPPRAYAQLSTIAAQVRARYPGADIISAGMSGDLEAAIEQGATHVRIGTALLGSR